MQTWQVLGIIGSIIGLTITLAVHLIKTSYYAGIQNQILSGLKFTVDKIEQRMAQYEAEHMLKEDAYREIGRVEAKADKAHQRIDELSKA